MLELEVIDTKRTGIIVYLHFSAGCVQSVFAGDLCITSVNLQLVPTPIACTSPAASVLSYQQPRALLQAPACPTLSSLFTLVSFHVSSSSVHPSLLSPLPLISQPATGKGHCTRPVFCHPKNCKASPKPQVMLGMDLHRLCS